MDCTSGVCCSRCGITTDILYGSLCCACHEHSHGECGCGMGGNSVPGPMGLCPPSTVSTFPGSRVEFPTPPSIIPANDTVMCEPPDSTQVKVSLKKGFATVVQKTSLTGLKVIEGNLGASPRGGVVIGGGDVVYVRGEAITNHQWAKEVFTIEDGPPFVLVPLNCVMVVKRG